MMRYVAVAPASFSRLTLCCLDAVSAKSNQLTGEGREVCGLRTGGGVITQSCCGVVLGQLLYFFCSILSDPLNALRTWTVSHSLPRLSNVSMFLVVKDLLEGPNDWIFQRCNLGLHHKDIIGHTDNGKQRKASESAELRADRDGGIDQGTSHHP
ncbi:uncharacterized protein BDZ83DRAFT_189791 [Colletotrichum acutatum]|uniref:Uncharacterized protein n=1 Tax=Glomerella acutata TaxID=27357 RepID=A0AAD8U7S0_GLOAC|nr:uncharacterized protein BDZ83DRAFT_189791 [Colletotrichum acutatum]KAK1706932.1 hypothetical protein BDZ83DRAFT_189791 [Colletotrichum acutatum]